MNARGQPRATNRTTQSVWLRFCLWQALDRARHLGEHLRALRAQDDHLFEPDAEPAGQIDAGFDGEDHAHAVAGAMGEEAAIAGCRNDLVRRPVNALAATPGQAAAKSLLRDALSSGRFPCGASAPGKPIFARLMIGLARAQDGLRKMAVIG